MNIDKRAHGECAREFNAGRNRSWPEAWAAGYRAAVADAVARAKTLADQTPLGAQKMIATHIAAELEKLGE